MTRTAIYARYSSDGQRATSIEDQMRNCRQRVDAEGWTVTATFADAAISGAESARPEYRAMLAAAERGEFDVLLIDDLGRLARDQVEGEQAIRRLEFRGVRIIAVTDGYDSQTKLAMRKIQRAVKGLMNEAQLDQLREHVHRGLTGQALKGYWCGGKPYGYRLKPILDPSKTDPYDQPLRIGTKLEVNAKQAAIVREIFESFIAGHSARTIAVALNRRGVPSSGSTWKRKTRRCQGWAASAVRQIIINPLFTGHVRWNVSQFVRNPDTKAFQRRRRPKAEWVTHHDESLRIVSDALYAAAQARTRVRANTDERLKAGGRAKYVLSGLLRCGACGAHYVLSNERSYACGGRLEGACHSGASVRRDRVQAAILDPLRNDLLAPDRVARMAREIEREYLKRVRTTRARVNDVPRELAAIDERLERLRERQRRGDPDMTAEDLQSVIDRLQAERQRMQEAHRPETSATAKLLAMLPKAAELYRKQIDVGLDDAPKAAMRARVALRKLCGGEIRLETEKDGSVWAVYDLQPAALVMAGVGTDGRGERI